MVLYMPWSYICHGPWGGLGDEAHLRHWKLDFRLLRLGFGVWRLCFGLLGISLLRPILVSFELGLRECSK